MLLLDVTISLPSLLIVPFIKLIGETHNNFPVNLPSTSLKIDLSDQKGYRRKSYSYTSMMLKRLQQSLSVRIVVGIAVAIVMLDVVSFVESNDAISININNEHPTVRTSKDVVATLLSPNVQAQQQQQTPYGSLRGSENDDRITFTATSSIPEHLLAKYHDEMDIDGVIEDQQLARKTGTVTRRRREQQVAIALTGVRRKWHKLTFLIAGPETSEYDDELNPFLDVRLNIVFTHQASDTVYTVPGFYAADGDAAETSAREGNIWKVHFSPSQIGVWNYRIEFIVGRLVAIQNVHNPTPVPNVHNAQGTFNIAPTNKEGRDHRGKGRLQYVGRHHMQFAETGEYFLKAGPDSPENFLAYDDFDNTPNIQDRRKSWAPHIQDHVAGVDPVWKGNRGRGIIGAINYISDQGMNVFSFLTNNINGDDKNVFPYVTTTNFNRFDVSKLEQWEIVFEHADKMGMMMHFKTFEQENDQLLDGGNLGQSRKLYYRELIARFSHHLALTWNLGEEISNTIQQIEDFSTYVKTLDPYNHLIVGHTNPESTFLAGMAGHRPYNGIAIQGLPADVYTTTLYWLRVSVDNRNKWVVTNDEQNNSRTGVLPDSIDPNHDEIRQNSLWGNIMAGGGGVEYYFGYSYENSDLTCEDFRSRENMFEQSKYALDFFRINRIPFQEMESSNNESTSSPVTLTNPNDWLLSSLNSFRHVVYRKVGNAGGNSIRNIPSLGVFIVKWYNPRAGGNLLNGSVTQFNAQTNNGVYNYGLPPNSPAQDWVVYIYRR